MIELAVGDGKDVLAEINPTRIKIIGCGGGGSSAVNRMIADGKKGVDFVVLNTDLQALHASDAKTRIPIGQKITGGLGAGGHPEVGEKAAEEDAEVIKELVQDAHMIIITAGMGGGTGTGSAPVVAKIAHEAGALTIAVVTTPFDFEGEVRMKNAREGLKKLRENVDSLIVVPNEQINKINENEKRNLTFKQAFRLADEVLSRGVYGIYEIITVPGNPNLDFADVKSVMKDQGQCILGVGQASGENRAVDAAQNAISNPLLEECQIDGAKKILVNISGPEDLLMSEVTDCVNTIKASADPGAEVIFGASNHPADDASISVTVIATGFSKNHESMEKNEEEGMDKNSVISSTMFEQLLNGHSLSAKKADSHSLPVASLFNDDELDQKSSPELFSSREESHSSFDNIIEEASRSSSKGLEPPADYKCREGDLDEPALWRNKLSGLSRGIDLGND